MSRSWPCTSDKLRNVIDRLPAASTPLLTTDAPPHYHHTDALLAEADLRALARKLHRSHPGAAVSLRKGLAETFTIS